MVPSESEDPNPVSVTRAPSFGDWLGPALAVGSTLTFCTLMSTVLAATDTPPSLSVTKSEKV